MKLDDLRAAFDALSFPAATTGSAPERDAILEARKLVAAAVIDDEFLVDCISREIPRLRDSLLGGLAPFYTMPATQAQAHAGSATGAHPSGAATFSRS